MVVHYIPLENLSTFIALHVAFTCFVSTTPSHHIVSKNFLETEIEARNDKDIYLGSDRGSHLVDIDMSRDFASTSPTHLGLKLLALCAPPLVPPVISRGAPRQVT
jgi:hypothetical protein